eukprot:8220729-Heterocapsa_arctica.AAC.1
MRDTPSFNGLNLRTVLPKDSCDYLDRIAESLMKFVASTTSSMPVIKSVACKDQWPNYNDNAHTNKLQ